MTIKSSTPSLQTLELFVHEITTGSPLPPLDQDKTLEQVINESGNFKWEDLTSLRIGGTVPSGKTFVVFIL